MQKYLEKATKLIIYLTFFVPLIVIPSSYIFPFIVPKIVWFRSLVTILLGLYILLLALNWQRYKPKFTILNLALGLFFLSFALSSFFGVDAYHSFWDNHERMLGLFTIIHYVIYYFIVTAVFTGWVDWKWALRVFLLAGSVVMFIGLLQVSNPYLLFNNGADRVASTLGNFIYMGGYGLFLSFAAFLLIIKEKQTVWKWVEIFLGALAVAGLFFSGTRGSILGLGAGVFVCILGYLIVLRGHKKVSYVLGALLLLIVLSGSLMYAFRKTNFVSSLPAIGRTLNTSFTDLKNSPRWIACEIAIESWKEKPVFGWGPNNYFYAFNKHYNPRSLDYGYGETWFDNAHNILLNTLATQGALGLIIYLFLFGSSFYFLLVKYKLGIVDKHVLVIVSSFLVAHLVQNITVFENITSYLYFIFWLAMINSLTAEKGNLIQDSKVVGHSIVGREKIGWGLISTVAIICFIIVYIFNVQPARANKTTNTSLILLHNYAPGSVEAVKKVLDSRSPHIDDIRSDVAKYALQVLPNAKEKMGEARTMELYKLVYEELNKNVFLHPLDIRNHIVLTQMAQLGASFTNDPNYIYQSEKILETALTFSPHRQQVIYALAGVKIQLRKNDEAIQLLEKTISENDRIKEGYWRLAYVYKISGKEKDFKSLIQRAETRGVEFTIEELNILNSSPVQSVKKQ